MDADPSVAVDSESTSKETEAPQSVKHFDDEKDELEFMGYTGLHRCTSSETRGTGHCRTSQQPVEDFKVQ